MGRRIGMVLLAVIWLLCAGLLISMGGGAWITRALLLLGLLAAMVGYLAPR